jgi:aspartyl-tRNA(Asn)/glutamyl-tRNA(Gln) amidotransferase subunit A
MRGLDALLGPSRPFPSTRLDEEFPSAIRGTGTDIMGAIGNAAGLPAISVPDGFTENGVPTGIQFVGNAYEENVIISAASAYQTVTDWHLRHPAGTLP